MWQPNRGNDNPQTPLAAEDSNTWQRRRISKLSCSSSLDTSGNGGCWEMIQSPLVSWTRAIIQRGILSLTVRSASYFNDVVGEQVMKAQACQKYFWV